MKIIVWFCAKYIYADRDDHKLLLIVLLVNGIYNSLKWGFMQHDPQNSHLHCIKITMLFMNLLNSHACRNNTELHQ